MTGPEARAALAKRGYHWSDFRRLVEAVTGRPIARATFYRWKQVEELPIAVEAALRLGLMILDGEADKVLLEIALPENPDA